MSLSLAKAELTGVFLESLSYGVYLLIFMQCMQVLQRRQSRPSDYLLGTAVSLFILVTGHLVVDIMRNMEAFTSNMGTPDYPNTYYGIYDTWKDIMKSALYVAVTVISDAFILYRSFIVWGRNYFVAVIPFLVFLADIAVGILWVYTLGLISPGENVYTDTLSVGVKTFYSITLSMNIMCTCLIALKIWKIQRAVAPFAQGGQNELSRLVAIVVESGFAYSATLVVMIATYTSNSPVMFIFLNSMPPIIGIVFSSVIVRIGKGLSHGDSDIPNTASRMTESPMHWAVADGMQSASRITRSMGYFPKCGVQVTLSHTVHTHIDGLGEEEVQTSIGNSNVKHEGLDVV